MRRIKHVQGQLPLSNVLPVSNWKPPNLSELPSWKNADRIAIDIETHDPTLKKLGPGVRREGFITGISFAIEGGPAYYLPVRHLEDNMDEASVYRYLKDQAACFKGELCGANLSYDLDYLAEQRVVFRNVSFFRDTHVAAPLIYELHHQYSLEKIAERLGIAGKDESMLDDAAAAYGVKAKTGMASIPARFVAQYAIQDVRLPLQVLRLQEKEIDKQELRTVYDLECRIVPITVKMRRRGVRIDFAQLQKVEDWSIIEEKKALDLLYAETGYRVESKDVNLPTPFANALRTLNVEIPKSVKKGEDSITQEFLSELKLPAADAIIRARKVNKLRNTFVKSIRKHAIGDRIHCSFNALKRDKDSGKDTSGAKTGRFSSSNPNLQQQPARDDFAKMWRAIYVPDSGGLWACCDFSQQEPRILTHFAEKLHCTKSYVAGDKYRNDPLTDSHVLMARIVHGLTDSQDPTEGQRKQCKELYLALTYSMQGASLSKKLGLPVGVKIARNGKRYAVAGPDAQDVIDQFNTAAPYVSQMAEKAKKQAMRRGFVRTLLGRRCRFEKDFSGLNFKDPQRALNYVIQGSAADQCKVAMVEADKSGFKLQLQVHDELDQTVSSPKEAIALGDLMEHCVNLSVPSKVDVEIGENWGYIKKV